MTNQTEQGASGRFTKKPVTIDAWLIDFGNKPLPDWVNSAFASEVIDWCPAGEGLYINTLEGHMKGNNGDWLIRGVKGELYACKPDIFAATYDPAGAVSTPEGCTSVAKVREAVDLLERITSGSCSCLTKTPDPHHHKTGCQYKMIREAIDLLEPATPGSHQHD